MTERDQFHTPVPRGIATDGQTLLATSLFPDQDQRLSAWRSADGGRTWHVSAASPPPGFTWLGHDRMIEVTGVTVDHRGELVVVDTYSGAWHGTGKNVKVDSCAVVWSGQLGALRRHELGCAAFSSFSSIATIADGRVLIANGTDLWIRG